MSEQKNSIIKRALFLSYFTIGYNIVECVLSIVFGISAGSVALVGFGLDSLVESLSAGVMVWRFNKHGKISEEDEGRLEKRAERIIGITFFILAAYVLYESISKLITRETPKPSLPGIIIAIASVVIMPVLYYAKLKTAKKIKSNSLIADAKETITCAFLSVSLLLGLGANYLFGFWQADPIVGFVIVFFLVREGIEIVKGEHETEP